MFKVNNKVTSATPMASVSIVNFEQVNAGWDLSNRKFINSMENAYLDKASLWYTTRFNFGSTTLFNCITDMPQAVDSELLLYPDDTCLVFQNRNIKTIEKHLNRDFSTLVDWLIHCR